jgi:hypothetical protein
VGEYLLKRHSDLKRPCVDIVLENADIQEVAIALVPVEAIADDKRVGDGEDDKAKQKWLHARSVEMKSRSLKMKQSEFKKYRSALESVRSLASANVEKALSYFSSHASRMDYAYEFC